MRWSSLFEQQRGVGVRSTIIAVGQGCGAWPFFIALIDFEFKKTGRRQKSRRDGEQIFTKVMEKYFEPKTDYCEVFDTEQEAIAACREVNRGLISKDPACCVVVDGPEDNYAVVDLKTAKDLLDYGGESPLPCLIVTD